MYTELSSTNASVKSLIDVDVDDSIYVFNLLTADFLFVPSAPSSIIIKSESVIAAPISVAPSISNEDNATFPAVEIWFNFESAIEPANSSLAIPLSFIVTAPLETLKLSELNEAIPLLDAVASSPDITPLFISIPSPAVYSVLDEEIVLLMSIDIPVPAV